MSEPTTTAATPEKGVLFIVPVKDGTPRLVRAARADQAWRHVAAAVIGPAEGVTRADADAVLELKTNHPEVKAETAAT